MESVDAGVGRTRPVTVPQVHHALRRLATQGDWELVQRYLAAYTEAGATAFVAGSFDRTAYWLGKQDVVNRLRWIQELPPEAVAKMEEDLVPGAGGHVDDELRPPLGRRGAEDLFAEGLTGE
jgi:hypothetical protein